MSKASKPQTIESLKLDALKKSHRYQLVLVALIFTVLGVVGGYFLSISVINQGIASGIEVVSSVKTKE